MIEDTRTNGVVPKTNGYRLFKNFRNLNHRKKLFSVGYKYRIAQNFGGGKFDVFQLDCQNLSRKIV